MLQQTLKNTFSQLHLLLEQLTELDYTKKREVLSGCSIGQHVRHIIELFQCLNNGYVSGIVCYDNRKRNIEIEENKNLAASLLHQIEEEVVKQNKNLILQNAYGDNEAPLEIETNYLRETVYNLEHTIHHMALIKTALIEIGSIRVANDFGVASSTVRHKKACAQ